MQRYYLIFKNHLYLLLGVLLVFIPLYPKFPLLNTAGTYVAIRLEDILIFFSLIIWLAVNLTSLKNIFRKTVFQAILLFWIIGALSLLSGIFITHSVTPHLGLLHWLRRIEYMSLFVLAATTITSVAQVKTLIKIFFAAAVIVIIYGFGQMWLNFPVISTTNKEFSKGLILFLTNGARVSSTFAGHYDLAIYLSFVLMFAANFFFHYKNIVIKILITLIAVSGFAMLGFTAARVSFVVTFIGLALILWLDNRKILVGVLLVAAVATVGLVPDLRHRLVATVTVNLLGGGGAKYTPPPGKVSVFTPIKQIPEGSRVALLDQLQNEASKSPVPSKIPVDTAPGEPVNSTELGVSRSYSIRLNVEWPRAINAFLKNPLLGSGYSSITLATDNDVLRSLGEVGILGTAAFGLVFFSMFKKYIAAVRLTRSFNKSLAISILSSTTILLLTGLFIDVFEASKVAEVYWLLAGMSWGILSATLDNHYNEHLN